MTDIGLFGLIITALISGIRIVFLLASLKGVFEDLIKGLNVEKKVYTESKKLIIEIVILLALIFSITSIMFLFAYGGNT